MGARSRLIQKRIAGVEGNIKITRAMELVAASRIVKATARLIQARPYAERIHQAIRDLSGVQEITQEFPLLKKREQIRTTGLLIITSDRGLAGAYNANLLKVAIGQIRRAQRAGRDVRLHVVGRKGQAFLRFSRYELASSTLGVADTPRFEDAEKLGHMLVDEFISEQVDEVKICFTNFRSAGSQLAATTQILPIQEQEVEPTVGEITPLYDFEPDPSGLLSLLLPRYINTVVFAALLESSASEHAARRRAMKAATENGEDLIKILTRVANRERQAEITSEIMEVVGGAEALREKDKVTA